MLLRLKYKIFRLLIYIYTINIALNSYSNQRNPFCYAQTANDLECLAMCKLNSNCFALVEYKSKSYKVKCGDKLDTYKITNVDDNILELTDSSGNKKALQLK